MSINSLHSVSKYSEELDKLFAQKSVTGFFADNDFGKKFVGAKTVIVPDIDFQGLADYDRENGFSRGLLRFPTLLTQCLWTVHARFKSTART